MLNITVKVDNREIYLMILKAKAKNLGYDYEEIKNDQQVLRFLCEEVTKDFRAKKS